MHCAEIGIGPPSLAMSLNEWPCMWMGWLSMLRLTRRIRTRWPCRTTSGAGALGGHVLENRLLVWPGRGFDGASAAVHWSGRWLLAARPTRRNIRRWSLYGRFVDGHACDDLDAHASSRAVPRAVEGHATKVWTVMRRERDRKQESGAASPR